MFEDGDKKTFLTVENTYCPDMVEHFECVGHYQKRLKSLTEPVINKLQNYFGIALRSNTGGTVEQMANHIWASFLHVASNVNKHYHDLCEKSVSSWYQYQRDQFNKTNMFKHGLGLTNDVIALVKPIYMDLIRTEEFTFTCVFILLTSISISIYFSITNRPLGHYMLDSSQLKSVLQ